MINKQFQLEVRSEIKKTKQIFLHTSPYAQTCRHWNFDKVQLEGLENFIIKRDYMSSDEIEQLIRKNTKLMQFFNYCLDIVPDFINVLRTKGHQNAFRLVYQNKNRKKDDEQLNTL